MLSAGFSFLVPKNGLPNPQQKLGNGILLFTMAELVVMNLLFLFGARSLQHNPVIVRSENATVRGVFQAMYGTMIVLLIRNIYRMVEFASGRTGFVSVHEGFFYSFDTLMILTWLALMVVRHFGLWLKALDTELQSKKLAGGATVDLVAVSRV